MRPLPCLPSCAAIAALVCLLHAGSLDLYAQNSALKQCSEKLHKDSQAISAGRPANQRGFVTLFDPIDQKIQQVYHNWAECVKGHQAPIMSFRTLDGESYDTASLAGKIVVVNFWFMGCVPCRAEMPALNRLVKEYKGKNVLFLGFTPDRTATLKPAFFQQIPFDFKIVADDRSATNSFFISAYPTTYIVDQRGVIRQAWIGTDQINPLDPYYKAKAAIDNLLSTNVK